MKKLEMLIGRVVLNILGGVVMAGLIIGMFALLGLLVQVIEIHFWLMIPLVLVVMVIRRNKRIRRKIINIKSQIKI